MSERVEIGPICETVAANIKRIRLDRGLTHRSLSARLTDIGHPLLPSGICNIEAGRRRIGLDDLAALAMALDASLADLMPELGGEHRCPAQTQVNRIRALLLEEGE